MKRKVILFLIFMQTVTAVAAGLFAGWLFWDGSSSSTCVVGDIDITGLSPEDAYKLLEKHYNHIVDNGILTLSADGKTFDVYYREAALEIKWEEALEEAIRLAQARPSLIRFVTEIFTGRMVSEQPQFFINKGLLMDRIKGLATAAAVEPVDAGIAIENGVLVKRAEKNGYRLDIGAAAEKILKDFTLEERQYISFEPGDPEVFAVVAADVTLDDFDGFEAIISTCSVPIFNYERVAELEKISELFRGLVIEKSDGTGDIFSYKEIASAALLGVNEGAQDKVATAIYGAFLGAGMDVGKIRRIPGDWPSSYARPGLEACVSKGDLALTDIPFDRVMLWTFVEAQSVIAAIIGPGQPHAGPFALRSEIEQVFEHAVVYVQDDKLKEGEQEVIEPGKNGMAVNVYRTATVDGNTQKELLYTDIYQSVNRIIRVGVKERTSSQK